MCFTWSDGIMIDLLGIFINFFPDVLNRQRVLKDAFRISTDKIFQMTFASTDRSRKSATSGNIYNP